MLLCRIIILLLLCIKFCVPCIYTAFSIFAEIFVYRFICAYCFLRLIAMFWCFHIIVLAVFPVFFFLICLLFFFFLACLAKLLLFFPACYLLCCYLAACLRSPSVFLLLCIAIIIASQQMQMNHEAESRTWGKE